MAQEKGTAKLLQYSTLCWFSRSEANEIAMKKKDDNPKATTLNIRVALIGDDPLSRNVNMNNTLANKLPKNAPTSTGRNRGMSTSQHVTNRHRGFQSTTERS